MRINMCVCVLVDIMCECVYVYVHVYVNVCVCIYVYVCLVVLKYIIYANHTQHISKQFDTNYCHTRNHSTCIQLRLHQGHLTCASLLPLLQQGYEALPHQSL